MPQGRQGGTHARAKPLSGTGNGRARLKAEEPTAGASVFRFGLT
jgi:hypothetical protein